MINPNRHVKEVAPYKLVHSLDKIRKAKGKEVFKLDWNESTVPPSKKVLSSIQRFLKNRNNLNWYADPSSEKLKKQISSRWKIKSDEILVTNGSDQAHELICNVYLEEEDEVIVPVPSYSNFLVWPKLRGAKVIELLYNIEEGPRIEEIISAVNQKTKIIYLINPYIHVYSEENIQELVGHSSHSLIIIDEAYYDFYGKSFINMINKHKNVIITRSFSKALSLAGLRLGYIAANKDTIDLLSRVHNFKSVNALAQIAGEAALKDYSFARRYVSESNKGIKLLLQEMPKLNFKIISTSAGFVLFKHKKFDDNYVVRLLEKNNIFVRIVKTNGDEKEYLRMNVGSLAQTRRLLDILIKLFSIRAVFIDRDGTIVNEPGGINLGDDVIDSPSKLRLLPHALGGLKKIVNKGYVIIVSSNQDGINRKQLSFEVYNKMNDYLNEEFGKNEVFVEKWLVCPHTPEEKCNCRKPKEGMINSLRERYYFNFKESYFIGDRESDMLLGRKLNMKTILVKRNEKSYNRVGVKVNLLADNLDEASFFLKNFS